MMPSARHIITLLVAAQLVASSVGDLTQRVRAGIIDPLLGLIGGAGSLSLRIWIFDIGGVIGGFFHCILTILVGLVLLRVVFSIAWRWMGEWLAEPEGVRKTTVVPDEVKPDQLETRK